MGFSSPAAGPGAMAGRATGARRSSLSRRSLWLSTPGWGARAGGRKGCADAQVASQGSIAAPSAPAASLLCKSLPILRTAAPPSVNQL